MKGYFATGSVSAWYEEPPFGVIKLLGELCDCQVTWRLENISLGGGAFSQLSGYLYTTGSNNEYLIIDVSPRLQSGANLSTITYDHMHIDPGDVEVYATCEEVEYGPFTIRFNEI